MLTLAEFERLGWFDPTSLIPHLRQALGDSEINSAGGTINTGVYLTRLQVSGTMTATLPDGANVGQRKKILCESAASSPALTLTITTPDTTTGFACASTWIFDTAGQSIDLMWMGAGVGWRAMVVNRAGSSGTNGVVIGTTVLTGRNLWAEYCLSVTGTVNSTGTKALPNGSAVGECITLVVTTAATIPVGSLDGVYRFQGAAKTHIQNIDATTEIVTLEWDGQAWWVIGTTLTSAHPTFA